MLSAKCLTQNCHLGVCFKRDSYADSGQNCVKYLQEAYLNNNLVFCLVAAFLAKVYKITMLYLFLRQLQCEMFISLLLKVLQDYILCVKGIFQVQLCVYLSLWTRRSQMKCQFLFDAHNHLNILAFSHLVTVGGDLNPLACRSD